MSSIQKLIVIFLVCATTSALTGPVSVTVLGGQNAMFHCSGSGIIGWKVDGMFLVFTNPSRGIFKSVLISPEGTVWSTLTVPATEVNNGTTVQCVLFSNSELSNNATLTILPGIGQVVNVRFTPSFTAVLWDPPPTAGVLGGIFYEVLVMNNNTGQVIVSATTNSTYYPLPVVLKRCQYYTANVTAFLSEHHGDSVVTERSRVPGVLYTLSNVSVTTIAIYNSTHFAVTFTVDIQKRNPNVCPNQHLVFVTYPTSNQSHTQRTKEAITQSGIMQHTIYVERGCNCSSNVMIAYKKRVVNTNRRTVHFSTYDIQSCDVTSDHTSISVTCAYTINSTGPGFVVIQNEQAQTTIKTLTNEGSVNITDLSPGNYTVKVYDDFSSLVYKQDQLQIFPFSSVLYSSTVSTDTSIAENSTTMHNSVSPTTSPPASDTTVSIIIPVFVVAAVSAVLFFIIFTIVYIHKRKRFTSVTLDRREQQRSGRTIELESSDLYASIEESKTDEHNGEIDTNLSADVISDEPVEEACQDLTANLPQREEKSQHYFPAVHSIDSQPSTDPNSLQAEDCNDDPYSQPPIQSDDTGNTNSKIILNAANGTNAPSEMDVRSGDMQTLAGGEFTQREVVLFLSDQTGLKKRCIS